MRWGGSRLGAAGLSQVTGSAVGAPAAGVRQQRAGREPATDVRGALLWNRWVPLCALAWHSRFGLRPHGRPRKRTPAAPTGHGPAPLPPLRPLALWPWSLGLCSAALEPDKGETPTAEAYEAQPRTWQCRGGRARRSAGAWISRQAHMNARDDFISAAVPRAARRQAQPQAQLPAAPAPLAH